MTFVCWAGNKGAIVRRTDSPGDEWTEVRLQASCSHTTSRAGCSSVPRLSTRPPLCLLPSSTTRCWVLFLDYQAVHSAPAKRLSCLQWPRSRNFRPALPSSQSVCPAFSSLAASLSWRWQLVNLINSYLNFVGKAFQQKLSGATTSVKNSCSLVEEVGRVCGPSEITLHQWLPNLLTAVDYLWEIHMVKHCPPVWSYLEVRLGGSS